MVYLSRKNAVSPGGGKIKLLRCLYAGVLMWMAGMTACLFFAQIFPVKTGVSYPLLLGGSFLLSGWYTAVYSGRKSMVILLVPTAAVLALFFWIKKEWAWNGIQNLADAVVRQVNAYHHSNWAYWQVGNLPAEQILLAALAVLNLWIGFYTVRHPSPVLALAPAIFVGAGGIAVGRFPQWTSVLLFITVYFSLRAMKHAEDAMTGVRGPGPAAGIAAGAGAAAVFLLVQFLIAPFVQPQLEKYQVDLRQVQEETVEKFRTGEVIEGTVIEDLLSGFRRENSPLNNDQLHFSGRQVIEVSLSAAPEGMLYLRGFVGKDYEGNSWKSIDPEEYDPIWSGRSLELQNLSYRALEDVGYPSVNVTLRALSIWENYAYAPYHVFLEESLEPYSDGSVRKGERNPMTYHGYPFIRDLSISGPGGSLESEYREFVYQTYRSLPQTGLERLRSQCAQTGLYGPGDLEEITDYIREVLSQIPYSQKLDPLPQGQDFAEFFLYEQKKGYCIHYATAAALMYRSMGIPARYVTGYAIPQGAFDEENHAYALDSMGHAWTEVYLDTVGWMPVDMTAPSPDNPLYQYQEPEQENSVSEQSRTENTSSQIPFSRPESAARDSSGAAGTSFQENTGGPGAGQGRPDRIHWGGFWIAAAVIFIPLLSAVCLRRHRRKKLYARNHPGTLADYRGPVRLLGREMFGALAFSGYRLPQEMSDRQYWEQVPVGESMQILLEKASYGSEVMTVEEYQQTLEEYEQVMSQLNEKWNPAQKFWSRYIRCWQ